MGGSSSKASSKVVTDIITNIITNDMLTCAVYVQQTQSIDIKGSGNVLDGVGQYQSYEIDIDCLQDSNRINELQNEIANAVAQYAEATGVAVISALGASHSKVKSEIINRIKNTVNMSSIMNCATAINQSQKISVDGDRNILRNVTQEQFAKMVRSCVQNIASKTTLVNQLDNEVDQESQATTEGPFDFITDAITDMFNSPVTMFFVFLVIIVAVIFAYLLLSGGDGPPPPVSQPPPMMPPPMFSPPPPPPQAQPTIIVNTPPAPMSAPTPPPAPEPTQAQQPIPSAPPPQPQPQPIAQQPEPLPQHIPVQPSAQIELSPQSANIQANVPLPSTADIARRIST